MGCEPLGLRMNPAGRWHWHGPASLPAGRKDAREAKAGVSLAPRLFHEPALSRRLRLELVELLVERLRPAGAVCRGGRGERNVVVHLALRPHEREREALLVDERGDERRLLELLPLESEHWRLAHGALEDQCALLEHAAALPVLEVERAAFEHHPEATYRLPHERLAVPRAHRMHPPRVLALTALLPAEWARHRHLVPVDERRGER